MTAATAIESRARAARAFRVAGWLILIQGVFMELAALAALPVLLILGVEQESLGVGFRFIVPFFQDNLYLLMGMSGVFGALRVIGAVALLRDRLWGLALSVIMCAVTLVLMIFLLPAGIADGLLSGAALVLILRGWFGSARVTQRLSERLPAQDAQDVQEAQTAAQAE